MGIAHLGLYWPHWADSESGARLLPVGLVHVCAPCAHLWLGNGRPCCCVQCHVHPRFCTIFFFLATTYLTYLPTCNVTYARVYSLTDNVGSDHSFTSTALFFCSMSCLLPSSTSIGSATSSVSRVLSIRLSTEAFSSSPSSPVVSCGEHMARGECPRTSIEPSSQIATSRLTPRARKLPTRCAK